MLVTFRRPKIAMSPSYADYRPRRNTVIFLEKVTLRGDHAQEG
jgi:hypothetical protein